MLAALWLSLRWGLAFRHHLIIVALCDSLHHLDLIVKAALAVTAQDIILISRESYRNRLTHATTIVTRSLAGNTYLYQSSVAQYRCWKPSIYLSVCLRDQLTDFCHDFYNDKIVSQSLEKLNSL